MLENAETEHATMLDAVGQISVFSKETAHTLVHAPMDSWLRMVILASVGYISLCANLYKSIQI